MRKNNFLSMNYDSIYYNSPVWLQNVMCDVRGYQLKRERFGKVFRKKLAEYESRNEWSYEQMCDFRDQKLRRMVLHCYRTVPYYKRLFDDGGINPENIKYLDDLKALPILTKAEVMSHLGDFISSDYKDFRLMTDSTSGSTGSSLIYTILPENMAEIWAVWWRYRHRLGITEDIWQADFGSKVIVPQKQNRPPYWRICHPLKQVKFSTFHGNSETYQYYFEEINRKKLAWIHGYPSCIVPFASFIIEKHLHFDHCINYVTTGGENLYDYQRKILLDAFGCAPRTHYGLTECVANFSERKDGICEVDEDFAAVEFVKADDLYRIIGTNLMNFAMPLLRYDTSDLALVEGKIGKQGRIVKFVDGRSGDAIFFPDGRRIGSFSALFTETTHILEAQIHQAKDYSITIRFVPKDEDWQTDIESVEKKFRDRIGYSLPVSFEKIEKVERTRNNKLRYVISEVQP